MSNNLVSAICFVPVLILSSCTNKFVVAPYPDPYAESFRSKGIKLVTIYDGEFPLNVDSLYLDDFGNIVKQKRIASKEDYRYDDKFFLTRFRKTGEFPKNYVITYQQHGNDRRLIQKWTGIKEYKWEYDSIDIDRADTFVVQLYFDKAGKLISEVNESKNRTSKYIYDGPLLISKETHDNTTLKSIEKYEYIYSEKKLIKKMKVYQGQYLLAHYHFSDNGLADSAIYKGSIKLKYGYKY